MHRRHRPAEGWELGTPFWRIFALPSSTTRHGITVFGNTELVRASEWISKRILYLYVRKQSTFERISKSKQASHRHNLGALPVQTCTSRPFCTFHSIYFIWGEVFDPSNGWQRILQNEKTSFVRSRISSQLIFASCVGYFDRAYYGFCVYIAWALTMTTHNHSQKEGHRLILFLSVLWG